MTTRQTVPLFSAELVNAGVDLKRIVNRVIDSHWYVMGREVRGFEAEFSAYVGVDHCVSLANGTDALVLALRAVEVGLGDRVGVVANAGFYSSTALHSIGALPLYIDVDEASLTMSVEALKSAIVHRPKAVIVTHLYGQLAAIEEIAEICYSNNVLLIEDCAQSHGAQRNNKRAGSFGDVGAFSFYPTKNLGALGDGGAITTSSEVIATKVRSLRQYGWSEKYKVATPKGCNSRLDEIQAAILREKLPGLNFQNAQRRQIAQRYNEAFAALPINCPSSTDEDYVGHLYVVRTNQRADLQHFLAVNGVSTDVHYPIADHLQPAYSMTKLAQPLPVTETACANVLSLPCFPNMLDDDVEHVIKMMTTFFVKYGVATC